MQYTIAQIENAGYGVLATWFSQVTQYDLNWYFARLNNVCVSQLKAVRVDTKLDRWVIVRKSGTPVMPFVSFPLLP